MSVQIIASYSCGVVGIPMLVSGKGHHHRYMKLVVVVLASAQLRCMFAGFQGKRKMAMAVELRLRLP